MKLSPIHRKLAICLTAALFLMWPVQSDALDQNTVEPQKTVSGPPSGVIPLGEVPMHATEALDFLHSLKTYELPTPKSKTIESALPEAIAQIGQELAWTTDDASEPAYAFCAAGQAGTLATVAVEDSRLA